jgi:hypothetical protein
MKPKYSLSKNNQLIINLADEVLRPRGEFIVGKDSQLTYVIKEPKDWRRQKGVPERLHLKGSWSLNKEHDLLFSLKKTTLQRGKQRLLLKTELKEARSTSLVFSLGTEGLSGTQRMRLLELKGLWQADSSNRLQFLVKQLKGTAGTLTFQGKWQVKNNSLVYTYKETALKTKKKYTNTLYFKGYWDIYQANRLTYILDLKNNSAFIFRAYLETPSLIAKRGVIKYRVGIGVRGSSLFKTEVVTLYGVWKFSRGVGLTFEMDYKGQVVKAIRFDLYLYIRDKNKITFGLRSKEGDDLGINLEFSRSFLKKEARWFLRFFKNSRDIGAKAGIELPW